MINNAHQSVTFWGNVLTIPKIQNIAKEGPVRFFSTQQLEFDAGGAAKTEEAKKAEEGKQIEEKADAQASGASETSDQPAADAEEEDDKDDERIHERFKSETMNVTADIQIECIAEPQFKEICELDGLTQ